MQRSKYDVKLPDTFSPDDFVRVPTADRLCVKCKRVPSVPLRSNCCNKLYCESCSVKNRKCGTHRRLNHYNIDKELQKKFTKLTRKCPNQRSGCRWKGLGWQLKQHLSKCPKTGILKLILLLSLTSFVTFHDRTMHIALTTDLS